MPLDPDSFITTWNKNDPDALERLQAALQAVRAARECHLQWGRLCEQNGYDALALIEYQLALRDNPDDTYALERLAVFYRERGEIDKALSCCERRALLQPDQEQPLRELVSLYLENDMYEQAEAALVRAEAAGIPAETLAPIRALLKAQARTCPRPEPEEEIASTLGIPSDADVVRFTHLFSGRENLYARQWWSEAGEGGYTPVHQPLVFQVARNHLLGSITIGVYPVRLDSTVTFCAIDIDINKRAIARARGELQESRRLRSVVASEARRFRSAFADLGIPSVLEDSGYKGRHIWIFLQEPVEASAVRQFGTLFLALHPLESVDLHAEFFPKQSETAGGVGNLIKLPLGIHRRTGRRGRLLLSDGTPDPDPFTTLRSVKRISRDALFTIILQLKSRRPPPAVPAVQAPDEEAPAIPPAPLPPAPAPAWTAADFETHPEISHILRCCPVMAALKEKVEKHKRLNHDEQVVLAHALGHSAPGVLAVNYLFDACIDVPADAQLQTPLSGNPVSCPKIRKRIPHITGQVDCNCSFDFAPDHYPMPRLHLNTMPKTAIPEPRAAPRWDPAERTRALGVLRQHRAKIEREIVELESDIAGYLETAGLECIELDEGALVLRHEEGALPALVWEPKAPAPASPAETGGGECVPS
jgi:hypothetical protein